MYQNLNNFLKKGSDLVTNKPVWAILFIHTQTKISGIISVRFIRENRDTKIIVSH